MLLKKLWQNRLTLAITESVTAGYVSYLITKIPGSSKVFKGGFIVYSSETKDRKSTRLNSSHTDISRMPSSA